MNKLDISDGNVTTDGDVTNADQELLEEFRKQHSHGTFQMFLKDAGFWAIKIQWKKKYLKYLGIESQILASKHGLEHVEALQKRHNFIEKNFMGKEYYQNFLAHMTEWLSSETDFTFNSNVIASSSYAEIYNHLSYELYTIFFYGYVLSLTGYDVQVLNAKLPTYFHAKSSANQ